MSGTILFILNLTALVEFKIPHEPDAQLIPVATWCLSDSDTPKYGGGNGKPNLIAINEP